MNPNDVPVIILAGGRGSRLGEYTETVPKPMVEIRGIPIIKHIVDRFQRNGFRRFLVAGGYKIEVLKEYFKDKKELDVTVVDTGIKTQTAGRLLELKDIIKSETFMLSYGDILTDYNPLELADQHAKNASPPCTLLTVHPLGRFGELEFDARGAVTTFSEKPTSSAWINGGNMCCSQSIFQFISNKSDVLETDVFSKLVSLGLLYCDSYTGFWRSVDTPKDVYELNHQ